MLTFCNVPNCAFYSAGQCKAVELRSELADRIVSTSGGTVEGCGCYIHINSLLGFTRALRIMPSPCMAHVFTGSDGLPYAVCGRVRVDWENLDEGLNGDYNPNDPNDVNLLRFTAYLATENGWEQIDDASYCTNTPSDTDTEVLQRMISKIALEYGNVLNSDPEQSVKKLGEELSWISPGDVFFSKEE